MFGFIRRGANRVAAGVRARVRRFSAADSTGRLLSPWTFDGGFSNTEIGGALSLIRARSRDMEKNSEHFARFLRLVQQNVVGDKGFTFKPLPASRASSVAIDAKAAKFISYHWWKWATDPRAVDLTGRKTLAAICRLAALNWARDGEAIIRVVRTAGPYGIALRLIRPDALDETMNGSGTSPDTIIRLGVEVDRQTLRPVAYYFRTNREDPMASFILNRPVLRVPAAEILHLYTQHDEAQVRGVPWGVSVLRKLKMLDEFNFAELVAARDEANTTGIFKCTQAGREDEIVDLNDDDEASAFLCQKSEPGTKYVLPKQWDYETHTPQHPNREVAAFKQSMLKDIASGLNLEFACFANEWGGVSFSSVRAGTLAERDHWRCCQADFIEKVLDPLYRLWLRVFLESPEGTPYVPSDFDRFTDHEFRGRTWEWVDPMKDVQAAALAVDRGWKTDVDVAAEYGEDFEENLDTMARLLPKKKAAGVLTEKLKVGKPGKEEENAEAEK